MGFTDWPRDYVIDMIVKQRNTDLFLDNIYKYPYPSANVSIDLTTVMTDRPKGADGNPIDLDAWMEYWWGL